MKRHMSMPRELSTALKALKKSLGLRFYDLWLRSDRTLSESHLQNLIRYGDRQRPGHEMKARPGNIDSLKRLRDALESEASGQPAPQSAPARSAPAQPTPVQPVPAQPAPRDLAEVIRELRDAVAVACHVRPVQVTIGIAL